MVSSVQYNLINTQIVMKKNDLELRGTEARHDYYYKGHLVITCPFIRQLGYVSTNRELLAAAELILRLKSLESTVSPPASTTAFLNRIEPTNLKLLAPLNARERQMMEQAYLLHETTGHNSDRVLGTMLSGGLIDNTDCSHRDPQAVHPAPRHR